MFSLSFLQYGSANSFVLRGILISGLDYLPGIRIPTPDPVPYVIRHITYVLITSSCVYHQLTCHTSGISVNVEWALALLCCSGIQDKEKPAWGQSSCSQQSLTITHEQMLMWHRVMCVLEPLQTMTRQGSQQLACIISPDGDSPEFWAPTGMACCQLQTMNYTDLECTVGWIQATY